MASPEPCDACSAKAVARCEDCGRRLAHKNSWAGRWARRHQSGCSKGVAFLHLDRLGILAVFTLAPLLSYLARIL